jgi:DNA helicase-2/ATP-dependent DNA helicase PcrA
VAYDPAEVQAAVAAQHFAARDANGQVRVIAGPGTGKSATIEERVRWLLSQGADPARIHAVSFTRASSRDLRDRIALYCANHHQVGGEQVRVTTLHALALRTLRAAGLLAAFPADPLVLDQWEQEEIFDAEFSNSNGLTKTRTGEIRAEHEAFWSTGNWAPPNYFPPPNPITPMERGLFNAFHPQRTHLYSCVLPGELIREVVTRIQAGTLNVIALLELEHVIVDEYQDLNPMDIAFIDAIVAGGATVFICGDDDQSLYSFRYALPEGIQDFVNKYPATGQHSLDACFRTTPSILAAAQSVIAAFPHPNRIPKAHVSLYLNATPPVAGSIFQWRFPTGVAEAAAIADSCRDLVAGGIDPKDILILLSNQRQLLGPLTNALDLLNVPYESPRSERFVDKPSGRLALAVIRLVCNPDDYVAYRTVVALRTGVGIGTLNSIAQRVIANNLNFKQVFAGVLPAGIFTGQQTNAIVAARAIVTTLNTWGDGDTIAQRDVEMANILTNSLAPSAAQDWAAYVATFPNGMTLSELREFASADNDEQQEATLLKVYQRLQLPLPVNGPVPSRIRIMTMHGSKGLSGKIVFVPGLEDSILPGPWRIPYAGLVLEAARLFYVSLTRARAACIVSFAQSRTMNGQKHPQIPSRFAQHLGAPFTPRNAGLSGNEVQAILQDLAHI